MNSSTEQKPCWRCKLQIDKTWSWCAHCGAKLLDKRETVPPQPSRDVPFLHDLYSFGWYNHDLSTIVNYDSIVEVKRYFRKDRPENHQPMVNEIQSQKILRTKIFAEYIALLETFGVLCISIRNRKNRSILWSYLNTEPEDVTKFYNNILLLKDEPKLTKILKLPSSSVIKKAALSNSGDVADIKRIDTSYKAVSSNMRILAELYRNEEALNVRIYNKIKHVFPIVEGQGWLIPPSKPDEVVILVEYSEIKDPERIGVWRRPLSQENADDEMQNIRIVTEIGSELLALCIHLNQLGLLFPNEFTGIGTT